LACMQASLSVLMAGIVHQIVVFNKHHPGHCANRREVESSGFCKIH
jgi:hypothetical protein